MEEGGWVRGINRWTRGNHDGDLADKGPLPASPSEATTTTHATKQRQDATPSRQRVPPWKKFLDDRKATDGDAKPPADLKRPDIMSSPSWKPGNQATANGGRFRFQRYERKDQREKAFLADDFDAHIDDVLVPDDDDRGRETVDNDPDYVLQGVVELSTEELELLEGDDAAFVAEAGETFYCAPRHECRLCR